MSCRLSREVYEHLIEQDIACVEDCCPKLEAAHVRDILKDSVVMHYEFLPAVARLVSNTQRDGDVELIDKIIQRVT